jgi:hypothetical protein
MGTRGQTSQLNQPLTVLLCYRFRCAFDHLYLYTVCITLSHPFRVDQTVSRKPDIVHVGVYIAVFLSNSPLASCKCTLHWRIHFAHPLPSSVKGGDHVVAGRSRESEPCHFNLATRKGRGTGLASDLSRSRPRHPFLAVIATDLPEHGVTDPAGTCSGRNLLWSRDGCGLTIFGENPGHAD